MDEKRIEDKIRLSFRNGEFLAALLAQRLNAGEADQDYLTQVKITAAFFRTQLEKLGFIKKLTYEPKEFWREMKDQRISFVDGGVSAANLPNAIPFAVRVGAYSVRCGDESEQRESFNFPHVLIDEVYSPSGEGWTFYDDPSKVCDATRMLLEACAAYGEAEADPARHLVCLHGPLVNPVAPYGLEGFPILSKVMFERLFGRSSDDPMELGFVGAYKLAIERCSSATVPVAGIVERDSGSTQFLDALLSLLQLGDNEKRKQRENLVNYGLSDSRLLSYVLTAGEYVGPLTIKRQGFRGKWPEYWQFTLEGIPDPSVYFLLSADTSLPLRIELNKAATRDEATTLRRLHHISRLLPNYVFPVGLQIVDQFAKIPRWLQKSVQDQYATHLLLKALETNDPQVIGYAKRVVLSKGRDWFLRPKHEF